MEEVFFGQECHDGGVIMGNNVMRSVAIWDDNFVLGSGGGDRCYCMPAYILQETMT
jgi:hypothetical protein